MVGETNVGSQNGLPDYLSPSAVRVDEFGLELARTMARAKARLDVAKTTCCQRRIIL